MLINLACAILSFERALSEPISKFYMRCPVYYTRGATLGRMAIGSVSTSLLAIICLSAFGISQVHTESLKIVSVESNPNPIVHTTRGQFIEALSATITVPDDYATIQEAINNANEGDTVFVRNGTYYENVIVNRTISVTGEDPHSTTINGSARVTAEDVQISGFHITFGGIGVYIYSADRTIVSNNLIDYNGGGIEIDSANQTVVSNNLIDHNGGVGLYLYNSFNNTIVGNTISNTTALRSSTGLRAQYSNDSLIYHNNFIHNTWAPLSIVQSSNKWDDGYPTGGNYWGPWAYPSDLFEGPYQNETGSDGIIDGHFWQIPGIIDNYPLAKPWPWNSHDLGLTYIDLGTPKTVVSLGSKLNISVYMVNYGDSSEILNVTTYVNTLAIAETTNLALASRNSAVLSITWDTAGFAKGNYTISAFAQPILGEVDIADNNLTGGCITVSRIGDLTGGTSIVWDFVPDGKVDGKDVAVVAICFGSASGCQPPWVWNPNCDVNNDGKVDGKDIAIVAMRFGQAGQPIFLLPDTNILFI
jgi:parallel beta-helix repeat protein